MAIIESHVKLFIPSRAFPFGATGQRAKGQTDGQNFGVNKSWKYFGERKEMFLMEAIQYNELRSICWRL